MPVAWATMDDGIVHAQALKPEVLRGARGIVEFDENFVDRIPNRDDFIGFLASDRLAQHRRLLSGSGVVIQVVLLARI